MTKLGILIIFIATVIKLYMSLGGTGTVLLGLVFVIIGGLLGANNMKITFSRDDEEDDDNWEE